MRPPFRLTRSNDIKRVRRNGQSFSHPLFVLIYFPNQLADTRFTVIASKRIGNAVVRNRTRRRVRACFRQFSPAISPGWDIVFLARQPLQNATYQELSKAVRMQLHRAGLLGELNGHDINI